MKNKILKVNMKKEMFKIHLITIKMKMKASEFLILDFILILLQYLKKISLLYHN